jgi:chitosanase
MFEGKSRSRRPVASRDLRLEELERRAFLSASHYVLLGRLDATETANLPAATPAIARTPSQVVIITPPVVKPAPPPTPAPTRPQPRPISGLTSVQLRRAEELIDLFEFDTPAFQYTSVVNINDGNGYTCGKFSFCTGTGDVLEVVERYTALKPGNVLAPYLPQLQQLAATGSDSTAGLEGFPAAWTRAANDSQFRAVQDYVGRAFYYQPSLAHAKTLGLRDALSVAVLYDSSMTHGEGNDPDGVPALIQRATALAGGTPKTGVSEVAWLSAFLTVRKADMLHPYAADKQAAWPASAGRCDTLRSLLAAGNLDLHGPFYVRSPYDGSDGLLIKID